MEKIYIALVILFILVIVVLIVNNKMMIKRNNMKNAYSSLDVMLKKRYDLIPNLVACTKEYMEHESEILEKIVLLRTKGIHTDNEEDVCKINNELDNDLDKIFLIAESYPNLKSSTNFIQLQETLTDVEEQIAAARRTYNAHVTNYNNYVSLIPINLIAKLLGFNKTSLFIIKEEEGKNKIWVKENEKE